MAKSKASSKRWLAVSSSSLGSSGTMRTSSSFNACSTRSRRSVAMLGRVVLAGGVLSTRPTPRGRRPCTCTCATAPAPHFRLPFRACLHWCCPHRCATHGLVTCSFATTISALRHPPHQILTTVALLAALCLFYLCPRIESVFRTPLVRGYSCRVLYGPKQSTTLEATSLMPCNHQPNLSTRCFPVHGLVQPLGTDPSYLVHL